VKSTHSRLYEHFISRLKQYRVERGITQAELAKRLHLQQSIVSKIERGERRIDVAEFVDIAHALSGDPIDFFTATVNSYAMLPKRPRLFRRR
jgi:transcriptional regulator with XRE-family HTH domain